MTPTNPTKGSSATLLRALENSGAWVSFDVLHAEMGGSAIGSSSLGRFHQLLGETGSSIATYFTWFRKEPSKRGRCCKNLFTTRSSSPQELANTIGVALRGFAYIEPIGTISLNGGSRCQRVVKFL